MSSECSMEFNISGMEVEIAEVPIVQEVIKVDFHFTDSTRNVSSFVIIQTLLSGPQGR